MKKTLIVLALAAALVLMFASVAMARPNGNIYISWDSTGANAAVPTPHAGYTSATEKCNVCHSVHYAATSNFTWPDTAGGGANSWTSDDTDTEMLLRSSVANACNYCHIETSIGGVQLYGGIVTNYTVGSTFAHNGPSAACSGCHAVHGANTFQGPNVTKILRVRADRPIQGEVLATAVDRNPAIASLYIDTNDAKFDIAGLGKYGQQIAFCTQCHAEYTDASESTITGGPGYYDNGSYIAGSEYKGHPLKNFDANFSAKGANFTGQAAWVTAETCRNCHDAGNVDEAGVTFNSFPHYTDGYFVFSTYGDFQGVNNGPDNARRAASDGNCLKCHINAAQDAGVGITF